MFFKKVGCAKCIQIMIIKLLSLVFIKDFYFSGKKKIAFLHVNSDRTRGCQRFYALFEEAQTRQHAQVNGKKVKKAYVFDSFHVFTIFIVLFRSIWGHIKFS